MPQQNLETHGDAAVTGHHSVSRTGAARILAVAAVLFLAIPQPAQAYIGPGAGFAVLSSSPIPGRPDFQGSTTGSS